MSHQTDEIPEHQHGKSQVVEGGKGLWQAFVVTRQALHYARRFSLPLVFALFALLAPPWVRQAVVGGFLGLPGDSAVVLADWKAFSVLPVPRWGEVTMA
jgi:hypothetical protein